MASCKAEGNLVERTEWSIWGIAVNVTLAFFGWYIASSVRKNTAEQKQLEGERAKREKELEEERADREKELEVERANREKELEVERAKREKELEDARIAREKKVQEARARLAAFDVYRRELGRFADGVIDVIAEIQTLIAFNLDHAAVPAQARQQFVEERSRLIGRVSSLIDRGRFFFPNREAAGNGAQEGAPQRGRRDPVLNRIVALRHIVKAIDHKDFGNNRAAWIRWPTLTNVETGREGHVCSAFRRLSEAEQSRLADEVGKKGELTLMDLTASAKRAFVSEVYSILQPEEWLRQVDEAYGINLLLRKPEGAGVHVKGG